MEQRRFPWLVALIAVGCLGILCIGALVIGGGALLLTTDSETTGESPNFVEEFAQSSTGKQRLDDHSLFDDFSSDSLGWPRFDDGKTILAYEDGAYSIQITEPDYWDWVYLPGTFNPEVIQFDVRGPTGVQEGSFGVLCQFEDEDNHYYVEFDLGYKSYLIAQYFQGEYLQLSDPGPDDSAWQGTDAFGSPSGVNSIEIRCSLDTIVLSINGELVDEVQVHQALDRSGAAGLFVYAFSDAGPEGYKVWFDNVEARDFTQ
jgi:hypothetical protein